MENYRISVNHDQEIRHFEVGEYMHHDGESCKFRVYENGNMVASFQPDGHQFLQICQNPGNIKEALLHLLADQIEAHHPHGIIR